MIKFRQHDCVEALEDIENVPKGATGTILEVFTTEDFLVEFTDGLPSYGVFTVKASQVTPWKPDGSSSPRP